MPLNYFQDAVVPHFDKGGSSSVVLILKIVHRHNLFSATMPRVNPIFIFESLKKSSLRLSHACNGSNFLKTRLTLNQVVEV